MAKGNHVFNDFDGCIRSSFADFLEEAGEGADHLRALGGSGGSVTAAQAFMTSRYARSWPLLEEIRKHSNIEAMHWIQDDAAVGVCDENSRAFGDAAAVFRAATVGWAWDTAGTNPMEAWRQLVNAGVDRIAWDRFVKGSSIAQAPASGEGRKALCIEIEKFVRGDLTKLAGRWLIALRMDLKASVTYRTARNTWSATLGEGLGTGWLPQTGAS